MYELGHQVDILVDESRQLKLSEVLQQPDSAWVPSTSKTPSFGFSQASYWVRFRLTNQSAQEIPLILEVGYGLLDQVNLYQLENGQLQQTLKSGDGIPFEQRLIEHREILFPLKLAPQAESQFYLQIDSTSSIQFPLRIWQKQAFYAQDQYAIFWHGLYYGLVLVMVLYNFFLFLRVWDRVYLFYVVYVATFSVTQMALSGFSYQLLWPDAPSWNQYCIAVLAPTIVAFGCVFVMRALKLRELYPGFHALLKVMVAAGIICAIASLILPYGTMIKFGAALVIVACSSALYISYYAWLRGKHSYAAFFSAAWTVFLFGVVCLALNKFGLIPRTFLTESAAQLGSALEIILLSYALAERLHQANHQRFLAESASRAANERLLAQERRHTISLEETVRQRTEELKTALEQVQSLNQELRVLSSTDALTGARNRRYMDELLVRELKRAKRNQSSLSLIMLDIDHFKRVNDTYGHPIGDQCLRMVTQAILPSIRRPPDEICRYGGEELAIILPETDLQGALHVAEKIRLAVEALVVETAEGPLRVTASLGVASYNHLDAAVSERLLQEADQALYRAKRLGRNRSVAYSPSDSGALEA